MAYNPAIGDQSITTLKQDTEAFDKFMESGSDEFTDRGGFVRKTLDGKLAQIDAQASTAISNAILQLGYQLAFTFTTGGTLTARNQIVQDDAGNGDWYRWNGSFPKVVAPGTDPASDSDWINVSDGILRSELPDKMAIGGNAVFNSTVDFAAGSSQDGVISDATLLALVGSSTKCRTEGFHAGTTVGEGKYKFLNGADSAAAGYVDGSSRFQIRSPLDVYACLVVTDKLKISQLGAVGSGDEVSIFKHFCQFEADKVLDVNVSSSGVGVLADGYNLTRSNNSVLTALGDVTLDAEANSNNQGQILEVGNGCVVTGVKIDGDGNKGNGFLVVGKTDAVLQLCESINGTGQCYHDVTSINTKYINCKANKGLHGINMFRSTGTKIHGGEFTQVVGGIWTAECEDVIVTNPYVANCEDVGGDWETSKNCWWHGGIVERCQNGELAWFYEPDVGFDPTPEVGNCGFIGVTVNRYATFTDRTDVVRQNGTLGGVTDSAALIVYGLAEDDAIGDVVFKDITVNILDNTATNPATMRAMTNRAAGDVTTTWSTAQGITFDNITVNTVFRGALRFQACASLNLLNCKINFKGVTQTSFDEFKDIQKGLVKGNTVTFDSTSTPWAITWSATSSFTPTGDLEFAGNQFIGGSSTAININHTGRTVKMTDNILTNNQGTTTGGLTVTSGAVAYNNQRLIITLPTGTSTDMSTYSALAAQKGYGIAKLTTAIGTSAGSYYEVSVRSNGSSASTAIESHDGSGASSGRFASGSIYASFAGDVITLPATVDGLFDVVMGRAV